MLVVVGNGMVGQYFLSQWANSELHERYELVTFCEEPLLAYDRVHLSDYFTGKSAEELSLVEDNFFHNNITVHLNDSVISINREHKTVQSR